MRFLAIIALALAPVWASANDSMAELKTGGLTYVRSDAVAMEREDLFISLDEVRVDYEFRNMTDEDVSSIVAFPMPDITGSYDEMVAMPRADDGNFLNFSVVVDGTPIQPALEQRASAFGLDITADLMQYGIPLLPEGSATYDALEHLPSDVIADWIGRGIIVNDIYDNGSGMQDHPSPIWTLQSTFWWRVVFPADEVLHVQHRYQPSVGGTVGVVFVDADGSRTSAYDEYAEKYCVDAGFAKAVQRRMADLGPSEGYMHEAWLSYILKTGQNWYGTIGTFHLTVDKGSADNLVSFCGNGLSKTGPTTFELTYTDFFPQRDLDVLIIQRSQ